MKKSNLSSKSAGAGLLVAFVASLCCIVPVFSLLAGITGIAATFSWMEPFRPYLFALTIGVLGFAWYQKVRPRTQEEVDCTCEADAKPSFWQSKKFLVIITVFAALMLAFPNYSSIFYPDSKTTNGVLQEKEANTNLAVFRIEGMTCAGCEAHIRNAVGQLEGVNKVQASYVDSNAIVNYDPDKVAIEKIEDAINKTGYKVIEEPSQK